MSSVTKAHSHLNLLYFILSSFYFPVPSCFVLMMMFFPSLFVRFGQPARITFPDTASPLTIPVSSHGMVTMGNYTVWELHDGVLTDFILPGGFPDNSFPWCSNFYCSGLVSTTGIHSLPIESSKNYRNTLIGNLKRPLRILNYKKRNDPKPL